MAAQPPEGTSGCPQCWPEDAAAAWSRRGPLAREVELIDESHLGVAIDRCPACGQLFIATFVEDVDWADGDDPQYWSQMPVLASEAERLRSLSPAELLPALAGLAQGRRSLRKDYPKGGPERVYWGSGLILG